jgi:hypothetical protein
MPAVGLEPARLVIGALSFRPRGQTWNGCVLGQPQDSAMRSPTNPAQTSIRLAIASLCGSSNAGRAQVVAPS